MKKNIFIILSNIALSLFQSSFIPVILGVTATPNLIFSLGFAYLLMDLKDLALFSVFFGGLFLDAFSGRPLGVSSLLGTVLIMILYLIRNYFFRGKRFIFGVSLIAFYLAQMIVTNSYDLSFNVLVSVLVTGLFGVLFSKLISSL